MLRQLSFPAVYMDLLAAFVGYSASFAIVLAGLRAMSAGGDGIVLCHAGHGGVQHLAALGDADPGGGGMVDTGRGVSGLGHPVARRLCRGGGGDDPVRGADPADGGFVPALGRVVAAIPKPIANGLLAGVLLKLCFAPALALGQIPLLVLPVMLAWLVGLWICRLAAMPFAVIAVVLVLAFGVEVTLSPEQSGAAWFPELAPILPVFTLQSFVSVAVPLYLVTMAGRISPVSRCWS